MNNTLTRIGAKLNFSVEDRVYLKLRQAQLKTFSPKAVSKLSPKFYGPYEVLAWVGKAAYKLQLPAEISIHPVFHVSLLKPSPGTSPVSATLPLAVPASQQVAKACRYCGQESDLQIETTPCTSVGPLVHHSSRKQHMGVFTRLTPTISESSRTPLNSS